LPLSGLAVADHQSVTIIIALASGAFDVFLHFGLKRFGEHPSRSGSSDLVEVEQEFFTLGLVLM
jgi:hypothetical protein